MGRNAEQNQAPEPMTKDAGRARFNEPNGLHELLVRAACDEAVTEAVQRKDLAALEALGISLTPVEARILLSLDPTQLEQLSALIRDRIPPSERRKFIGCAVGAVSMALLSGAIGYYLGGITLKRGHGSDRANQRCRPAALPDVPDEPDARPMGPRHRPMESTGIRPDRTPPRPRNERSSEGAD